LRASSNGQAFECSASSRSDAAVSAMDIMLSGRGHLIRSASGGVNRAPP
jgi:hypothetical protein